MLAAGYGLLFLLALGVVFCVIYAKYSSKDTDSMLELTNQIRG